MRIFGSDESQSESNFQFLYIIRVFKRLKMNINLLGTISLSDRPGHFFFNQVFDPVRPWPYHGLTDRGFFIFFSNTFLTLNVSDHTMVCETVVWSLTSRCKISQKKTRSDHWGLLNLYVHWWVKKCYRKFPLTWWDTVCLCISENSDSN